MDVAVCFLIAFCLDKFVHLSLGQILKIVSARHVDKHTVPFDKWSETSRTFRDRFVVKLANRRIRDLFGLDELDRFFGVDGRKVRAAGNRDKFVAPFYIRAKAADADRQVFAFVIAHRILQFE